MLKLSDYTICLPLKDAAGRHFLLNSRRGDYHVVDTTVAKTILSVQKDPTVLFRLDQAAVQKLQDLGCLVPAALDEEKMISQTCRRIHDDFCKRLSITLIPGYACNFNCPYCFEKNIHQNAPTWYKERMSVDLVDAIFEALDRYMETGKEISGFTLFGGEPFLPHNKDIVGYILDKCTPYNAPITVVTNGYYLDEYLELLKHYKISALKITIDGPKEIHDLRRAPSGGKSFDRIMQNVRRALENGITVSLRTNVNRENYDSIYTLPPYYEAWGLTKFGHFSYYFKATMSCFEEEKLKVCDTEIMASLGNTCDHYCLNSAYSRIYRPFYQMLKHKSTAFFKSEFCGAHSGNLVIDPLGQISACWDLLPDQRNIIGRVDIKNRLFSFNDNYSVWHSRTVDQIPHCRSCRYKLFCGGGCAAQGLVLNNNMNMPFCDAFIERFHQTVIETASEMLRKGLLC